MALTFTADDFTEEATAKLTFSPADFEEPAQSMPRTAAGLPRFETTAAPATDGVTFPGEAPPEPIQYAKALIDKESPESGLGIGIPSVFGLTPETIPSGKTISQVARLSRGAVPPIAAPAMQALESPFVSVPASSVAKTITSLAEWASSPKGLEQLAALEVPGLDLVMAGKFIKDMAKGGYLNLKDATKAVGEKDWQGVSDNVIGAAANFIGAFGAGMAGKAKAGEYLNRLKKAEPRQLPPVATPLSETIVEPQIAPKTADLPAEQPTTKGEPSAETIRGDQGQLPTPRQVSEGGEAPRGDDVQQPPPGPPNAPAPEEGQAGREVLLTPKPSELEWMGRPISLWKQLADPKRIKLLAEESRRQLSKSLGMEYDPEKPGYTAIAKRLQQRIAEVEESAKGKETKNEGQMETVPTAPPVVETPEALPTTKGGGGGVQPVARPAATDPRLMPDADIASEVSSLDATMAPHYQELDDLGDSAFTPKLARYTPEAQAIADRIKPFARRKENLLSEAKRRSDEIRNKQMFEARDKRVAEAPVFQRRNGWEIVKEGVDYVLRDPATKEDIYRGKLSRVREVADESKPQPAEVEEGAKAKPSPAKPVEEPKKVDPVPESGSSSQDLHNAVANAMSGVMESLKAEGWTFDPQWGPLELVLPKEQLDQWMFMGKHPNPYAPGKSLFEYKNGVTRRYLRLDDEGISYGYNGSYEGPDARQKYPMVPLEQAIDRAYEGVEAMGYTMETKYNREFIEARNKALLEAGFGVSRATPEGTLTSLPKTPPEAQGPGETAKPSPTQPMSGLEGERPAAQPPGSWSINRPKSKGEPNAPAVAAKVEQEVGKVGKSEGTKKATAIKKLLVSELDSAIKEAPNSADVERKTATNNKGKVYETQPDKRTKITIDIPDDGEFTVWNTKENLTEVRDRAKAIKTTPQKGFKESKPGAGIPPEVFVESSEPTHMVWKGTKEEPVSWKGKRVELDTPNAAGLKTWLTSDGKTYEVVEESTGRRIGPGEETASLAMNRAAEKLDEYAKTKPIPQVVKENIAAGNRAKPPEPLKPESTTPSPGGGVGVTPQPPKWLSDMAKKAGRALFVTRKSLAQRFKSRPERHIMDQTADAIDNSAMVLGRQMGNRVGIGVSDVQDRAASAVIAAKFNRENLPDLLAKAIKGKNVDAANAIRYAQQNWSKAEEVARRGQAVFDWQLHEENSHGINTLERDDYLPGVYDTDLWMGNGRPYMTTGGAGLSTAFKKGKTYDSPFHAIEDGYVPKTLKLSELVEHRVKQGQRLINRVEWGNSLRDVVDPTDHKPIVESLIKKSRGPRLPGYEVAPVGYARKSVIPGVDIAVHEDYSKLFDALTGTSKVSTFEPLGVPVGQAALQVAGGIKHGLLLFDTFHVSRIGQKQMSLKGKPSYAKGLTLLDYSNRDLDRAVQAGDITQDMADYARANRPQFQMLLKAGMNVGRVQESMYNSVARAIPGIGTFNKWVFEKMTRGAMAETGLIEFEKVKKENPNLSDKEVAIKVARDINQLFGNLGRQGVFKDQTFLDLSRLVFLAPQWVESMARTELRSLKGMTVDPLLKGEIPFIQARGSIGRSMRNGLLAYFVGTQLLNLATRGKFTWQNEEKGHKLDAWIPDVTGKSKGFFLSPFAVFAELTHDLIRYSRQEPDVASALSRIASNKLSPFGRAEEVLRTGRDWDRQKIIGSWERARHAAWALAPTPIPLSAPIKAASGEALYPGQVQRQITASAGVKTEPAETAQTQIRNLAKTWLKDSPIPALRAKYDRSLKQEFGDSDYKPLRTALIKGDMVQARRQLDVLLETKPAKVIIQTMRPLNTEGLPKPFTGARSTEVPFIRSLTPEEKQLYREALKERIELYQRFVKMVRESRPQNN